MGSPVNLITSSRRPKNFLYNGGFGLWQRGTTVNGTVASYFVSSDRWGFFSGNVSNYTISRLAHSNTNLAIDQGRNGCSVQRNAGNTSVGGYQFNQTLERRDSQLLAGKTITLSFSARKGANYSAAGSILQAYIVYTLGNPDTNIINGWVAPVAAGTLNAVLTTTNQRFSVTGTIPANAVGVAVNFIFVPVGTAGAADLFVLEDVMLEENSAATEFETQGKTFAEELFLCQRYYEKSYALNEQPGFNPQLAGAHWWNGIGVSNRPFTEVYFKVSKRTAPVVAVYNPQNGIGNSIRDSDTPADMGANVGRQGINGFSVNPAATPGSNAVLGVHWTAEAEL